MPMLIGTSGWQYRDWRGGLYPEGVPQRLWLEHYAAYYLTVENNNSFYRLPSRETFAAWRERTPDDFVMTVKASRYLTHVRRLRDPAEPVARLVGAAAGLGPKLGPVLLQLPPTLKSDPDMLDACLKEFRTVAATLGGRVPEGVPAGGPHPGRPPAPARGGAAARDLVDRRDTADPGRVRRDAVLGRPARPPDHTAVAHRDVGLSAVPRGHGRAVAQLRPAGAEVLGDAADGDLAG
jgi:hypothetical protein